MGSDFADMVDLSWCIRNVYHEGLGWKYAMHQWEHRKDLAEKRGQGCSFSSHASSSATCAPHSWRVSSVCSPVQILDQVWDCFERRYCLSSKLRSSGPQDQRKTSEQPLCKLAWSWLLPEICEKKRWFSGGFFYVFTWGFQNGSKYKNHVF